MGKPYGHQYFFAGSGTSCGTMICSSCNQPIFNHAHDWVSYQKDYKDEAGWPDWKYVSFHRKCYKDDTGWSNIEKKKRLESEKHDFRLKALQECAAKLGFTCPYEFAIAAAESLGEDDLNGHYFMEYGSC